MTRGAAELGSDAEPAPGLYLHLPFCSEICPYCDFAVVKAGLDRRRGFVDELLAEARLWAGAWPHGAFDTVYLGGGTPSLLAPDDLERILESLREDLPVAPGTRYFLEVNPEDVTVDSARGWRDLGFATVSLGAQSLDDEELAFLGRRHTGQDVIGAMEALREASFETVSMDLIYGLPMHDLGRWRGGLEAALELAPDHLSCYQLTIEPGTPFARRREAGVLSELANSAHAGLFRLTHEHLAGAGLPAYEVSNFARGPEHRSRHNRKYWRHVAYLGLGPSAHSFDGSGRRWWNERRLGRWRAAVGSGQRPVAEEEDLSPAELALEALMLGLRTTEGVDLQALKARWGIGVARSNRQRLEDWSERGFVELDGARLVPTLDGLAIADGLAAGLELAPG